MYKPYIFKLDDVNTLNELDNDNIILSSTVNQPLFSLGFHYYLDRTRNDLTTYNKLIKSENNFYYIINPFETTIPNYDDNLTALTHIYFNMNKNTIINPSFYKLWEMLYFFELADHKVCNYIAIDKTSSGFMKALSSYREKYGFSSKNDKVHVIASDHDNKEKHIDITQPKLITAFKKDLNKKYANLITCNNIQKSAENTEIYDNYQEQSAYKMILAEIICALKLQEKGGNFVLRVFDTFTHVTLKMIYILTMFYNEVYIYKPFFSRPTVSDKYIICKNFEYDQDSKLLSNYTSKLDDILNKMTDQHDQHVYDILPNLELPTEFLNKFKFMNIKLVNPQQIMINNIITYIKENNYYGDKFQMHREAQINATKWWSRMFYPPSKNLFDTNKKELTKLLETSQHQLHNDENNFIANIL